MKNPKAGQVWEGRTKPDQPIAQRRILAILPVGIAWEIVGEKTGKAQPLSTHRLWSRWAKRLISSGSRIR
jgi:hypothetical protein